MSETVLTESLTPSLNVLTTNLVAVNLGDVVDQIQNTAGVTPLVVVPGDQLDEVVVQGDTSLGVEDGGSGVAVHVGGDNVVLSVSQDTYWRILLAVIDRRWSLYPIGKEKCRLTLVLSLSGLLDDLLDLLV